MHDVFISYSHVDVQVADAICHRLEESGIRCWYAPRNIEPGVEWADAIMDAIEACSVMVLVFTDRSNDSRQVRREVDAAINAEKTIIPFKYTRTEPSGSMRYYLSTLHWLDAVDAPLETSIDELRQRAQALLADAPSPLRAADEPKDAQVQPSATSGGTTALQRLSAGRRAPLMGLAALLVLALVIALALPRGRGSDVAVDGDASAAASADTTAADADATNASDTQDQASTTSDASDEPAPIQPAEGDEEAADNYLYTLQSGGTEVRLDRYLGPQTAKLVLPTTLEGIAVTSVGEKCFEDCAWIEEVVFPERMEHVLYRAFYGCTNLTTINIPASLKHFSGWSFAHCGFVEMVLPDTFTSLDYGAFYGNNDLRRVVLPEAVDYLGENTFRLCDSLASVTIRAAEPEIDAKAFEPNTDVVIIGVAGSYTEKYAKGMGLTFQAL